MMVSAVFIAAATAACLSLSTGVWAEGTGGRSSAIGAERAVLAHPVFSAEQADRQIAERYADESFVAWIRQMHPLSAQALLEEVCDRIERLYYVPIAPARLRRDCLARWRRAADHPLVRRAFSLEAAGSGQWPAAASAAADRAGPSGEASSLAPGDLLRVLQDWSDEQGFPAAWSQVEWAFALADSLDPYSHLVPPARYETWQNRQRGEYVGLGLDLNCDGEYPTVFDVLPGGPAARAGIRPGDVLLAAAGRSLRRLSDSVLGDLLGGPARTAVTLTVRRRQEQFECEVLRTRLARVSVRNVHRFDSHPEVGYLRIAEFASGTAGQIRRACRALHAAGARRLILDLRSNGGGLLDSAVDSVRLFVPRGTIVTLRSAGGIRRYEAGSAAGGDEPDDIQAGDPMSINVLSADSHPFDRLSGNSPSDDIQAGDTASDDLRSLTSRVFNRPCGSTFSDEALSVDSGSSGLLAALADGSLELPLVLLVDGNTASAAEIFCAALQEHDRAVIVGSPTRGKSFVQTLLPLRQGPAALCLTTAAYYTPDQRLLYPAGLHLDHEIRGVSVVESAAGS
ncbi:MAG: PDZ domain-containing protein, partial [Sedimentisphaerales bacterium]|nr:PDZ domain-containing protein [Sedimentisphaerales bacterium]